MKPDGHDGIVEQIEVADSISPAPENPNYFARQGLRTECDGVDHSHCNTVRLLLKFPANLTKQKGSIGFIMTVLGCSFALAGAHIAPLLYLTLTTAISLELNAPSLTIWLFTAGMVAAGALAPFVGPLADMFGRRVLFIIGLILSISGAITCSTTPTASGFIAGQCLLGLGAVIQELLAIAVVAESVPTTKRSLYAVLILCTIIPWSPGTLYAN